MISDFYTSSVTVQQRTSTKLNTGGLSKDYSTRISSLKCRISSRNSTEGFEFGKKTGRTTLRLYCEASATNRAIVPSDRITYSSRTFEIMPPRNPGERNHHLEIDLVEIV